MNKINAAIDDVAQAQINHLQTLQKSNSKWNETEAGANEYLEILYKDNNCLGDAKPTLIMRGSSGKS